MPERRPVDRLLSQLGPARRRKFVSPHPAKPFRPTSMSGGPKATNSRATLYLGPQGRRRPDPHWHLRHHSRRRTRRRKLALTRPAAALEKIPNWPRVIACSSIRSAIRRASRTTPARREAARILNREFWNKLRRIRSAIPRNGNLDACLRRHHHAPRGRHQRRALRLRGGRTSFRENLLEPAPCAPPKNSCRATERANIDGFAAKNGVISQGYPGGFARPAKNETTAL